MRAGSGLVDNHSSIKTLSTDKDWHARKKAKVQTAYSHEELNSFTSVLRKTGRNFASGQRSNFLTKKRLSPLATVSLRYSRRELEEVVKKKTSSAQKS